MGKANTIITMPATYVRSSNSAIDSTSTLPIYIGGKVAWATVEEYANDKNSPAYAGQEVSISENGIKEIYVIDEAVAEGAQLGKYHKLATSGDVPKVVAGDGIDVDDTTGAVSVKVDETSNAISVSAGGVKIQLEASYEGNTGILKLSANGVQYSEINLPLEQNLDAAKWFLNQASFDADAEFKAGILNTKIPADGAIVMKMIVKSTTPSYSAIIIPTAQLIPSNVITESEVGKGLEFKDGKLDAKVDISSETYLSVSAEGLKLDGIATAIVTAVKVEENRAMAAEKVLDERIAVVEKIKGSDAIKIDKDYGVTLSIDEADMMLSQGGSGVMANLGIEVSDGVLMLLGKTDPSTTERFILGQVDISSKVINGTYMFVDGAYIGATPIFNEVNIKPANIVAMEATIDKTYLVMEFYTSVDGKFDYSTVNMSDLIKVYTSGNGIDIKDYVVSSVVAPASNLTVTKEGIGFASGYKAMSTLESTKLDGVEEGAQVNKIEKVLLNGGEITIQGKSVNIDLSSYVNEDKFNTALAVKLEDIVEKDNSIAIDRTTKLKPKISAKISTVAGNALSLDAEGLYVAPVEVEVPIYTLVKNTESVEGLASQYWLSRDGVKTTPTIDIPKDQFLKSADFIPSATQADKDIDATVIIGDPYLKFVLETKLGDTVAYIAVKKLVDVYTPGAGIKIVGNEISVDTSIIATKASLDAGVKGLQTQLDTVSTKLGTVEEGAEVNVLESVVVNGVTASIVDKKATVIIGADKVSLTGYEVTTSDKELDATTLIKDAISVLEYRVKASVTGRVNAVQEGKGVKVDNTDPAKPIVSAKISADAENQISVGKDDGLFVPPSKMKWEDLSN